MQLTDLVADILRSSLDHVKSCPRGLTIAGVASLVCLVLQLGLDMGDYLAPSPNHHFNTVLRSDVVLTTGH